MEEIPRDLFSTLIGIHLEQKDKLNLRLCSKRMNWLVADAERYWLDLYRHRILLCKVNDHWLNIDRAVRQLRLQSEFGIDIVSKSKPICDVCVIYTNSDCPDEQYVVQKYSSCQSIVHNAAIDFYSCLSCRSDPHPLALYSPLRNGICPYCLLYDRIINNLSYRCKNIYHFSMRGHISGHVLYLKPERLQSLGWLSGEYCHLCTLFSLHETPRCIRLPHYIASWKMFECSAYILYV